MLRIRFNDSDLADFVGKECVEKYTQARERILINELSPIYGEIEITDDAGMSTTVEGDFDGPSDEQEAADLVYFHMNKIGNSLTEICA
jgi:hypothetical protein